jgi:hypothetical protein
MSDKTSIRLLAALMWIFIALAAVTVVPFSAAKLNDLGYYSLCSFTPWSTLALLAVAGVAWAILKYLVTRST